MKTSRILWMAGIAAIWIAGCGQKHGHEHHGDSASHTDMHKTSAGGKVELDQGKKWKVNPEMMVHVTAMQQELNTFDTTGNPEYAALADRLQKHINGITGSCTMEGKAHDELHKWLLPHIEMVKELKSAPDASSAHRAFLRVKASMDAFYLYFE